MLRSMNLKSLNPHITCVLCGGYLVDATTIIECLHSFCRNCIVRYLETSFHCPVCDVEIHKTRPLLHIRPDRVLQDIVYKLVPGLCHEEQKLRNEIKEKHKLQKTTKEPVEAGQGPSSPNVDINEAEKTKQSDGLDIDDPICISMEYYGRKRYLRTAHQIFPTRYLRCSSKVTVGVLKKFLSLKFGIPPTHQPELVRSDEILDNHITMKELSRIYGLHTKSYLDLQYIFLTSKEDDELKSEGAKKAKIDRFQHNMVVLQPQQVKRKRRRRRKRKISTEQLEEKQPKRRRKRRELNDVRTNINYSQDEEFRVAQPEQLPNELQDQEDYDFASRVPLDEEALHEQEKHSPSEINHEVISVDDQMEQDLYLQCQKTEPFKQPTEISSSVIKGNEVRHNCQVNGQQFKENERTTSEYEKVIRSPTFLSVVKHTAEDDSKDKQPLDLFKIPALPPLRSRNLDRQAVHFTDSFC